MLQQNKMLVGQSKRLQDVVSDLVQAVTKQTCSSCGQSKNCSVDESTSMNMPLEAGQMMIAEAIHPNNKYMSLTHVFHKLNETVLNGVKIDTVFDTYFNCDMPVVYRNSCEKKKDSTKYR
eukprot:10935147-Ditylum_brightwellii.AAC.1